MFRFVVLGLLRRGDIHHGYALMKVYRERSGLRVSSGSFYRELQRLVSDGLVQVAVGMRQPDERRAPYRITAEGEAAFDTWLTHVMNRSHHGCDDELTSRALFVGEVNTDVVKRILDGWHNELWLEGKLLERSREAACNRPAPTSGALDTLSLLIMRRLKHVAADLEFVEEFRSAYFAAQSADNGRIETSQPVVMPVPARMKRRAVRAGETGARK